MFQRRVILVGRHFQNIVILSYLGVHNGKKLFSQPAPLYFIDKNVFVKDKIKSTDFNTGGRY